MTNGWHPQQEEPKQQSAQATLTPEARAEARNEKKTSAKEAADCKDAPATDDGE